MVRNTGKVHVVKVNKTGYVDKQGHRRDYSSAYLRRTYRDGGTVKNETVANLSALPGHVIDLIDAGLKGQRRCRPGQQLRPARAGTPRGRAVMTARPARILAAAAGITAAAPAALATALINAAILRKPPLSDETSDDSNLVAATTAAAQREGRAWMAATPHQRWTVAAHDGTRLAGYYFPAPRPAHRTVILIHGHRADASLMGNFARDYRARGFNVFMADNRAHGDSGGRYVGMGWLDHFDYLRWIRRLAGTAGPDAGIVLHGISMGGATALLLSGSPDLPPQVRAVISDWSPGGPAAGLRTPLLASWHDQLAAPVERFLFINDAGSHRLTSARLRFGGPPRFARLL